MRDLRQNVLTKLSLSVCRLKEMGLCSSLKRADGRRQSDIRRQVVPHFRPEHTECSVPVSCTPGGLNLIDVEKYALHKFVSQRYQTAITISYKGYLDFISNTPFANVAKKNEQDNRGI